MPQDPLSPEQHRAAVAELLRRFDTAPPSATDVEEILIAAGGGLPAELFDSIMADLAEDDARTAANTMAGNMNVPDKAKTMKTGFNNGQIIPAELREPVVIHQPIPWIWSSAPPQQVTHDT